MLKGDINSILVTHQEAFPDIIRETEGPLENELGEKIECCMKIFVL